MWLGHSDKLPALAWLSKAKSMPKSNLNVAPTQPRIPRLPHRVLQAIRVISRSLEIIVTWLNIPQIGTGVPFFLNHVSMRWTARRYTKGIITSN
jgi:hypothetical protein